MFLAACGDEPKELTYEERIERRESMATPGIHNAIKTAAAQDARSSAGSGAGSQSDQVQ
jgi:hypothetical protein